MDSAIVAASAVSAAAGGGVGHLLAYLTSRRQHSGAVATTDADRLWAAHERLLEAYVGDNTQLRKRIDDMEGRERACEERNRILEDKLHQQTGELVKLKEQVASLLEVAEADAVARNGRSL